MVSVFYRWTPDGLSYAQTEVGEIFFVFEKVTPQLLTTEISLWLLKLKILKIYSASKVSGKLVRKTTTIWICVLQNSFVF